MSANAINWFEIYVQDMDRAKQFYETMLAVELRQLGNPDLPMWAFPQDFASHGSSGALVYHPEKKSGENSTVVYFTCDDCAVEAARVEAGGGSLEREKISIGEYGFVAIARDPDGNLIGLHSNQ